ncbi:MAG TPA: DUF3054 domain-containing protein [Actinomycetales bacterium]|nr:DUF3054 domain-containing protein [Actinomycetales bacterium]
MERGVGDDVRDRNDLVQTADRGRSTRTAALTAAAADTVAVLAFAAAGRRSHTEGLDVTGVLATAAPFLAGAAGAWAIVRAWRRPRSLWPTAVGVWLGAVAGGMGIRALTGQGTAPSFIAVATTVLGVLLVGWRAAARLSRRR